ncbi:MAG TPA: cyclodeaminase/cyclohydrolase family protein [Flavipsychrobacter sp.]
MSYLLDLPAKQMLEVFSKGIGMPGSGCVAAFSALSGVHLLVSVCKLTTTKERYKDVHEEIARIQAELENTYIPRLAAIVDEDAAAVKEMLRYRILRDKETDEAKQEEYRQQATEQLKRATATMMDLCSTCLDIVPMVLEVYDVGLKSARGDTAVVFSNLLSGAASGLYTVLINIKHAKGSDWATATRAETETFFGRLHEYQYIFSGRLAAMYNNS